MTRSCSMSRISSRRCAAFSIRRPRRAVCAGTKRGLMTQPNIAPGRFDLSVVADMVEPGSRVLDVGCGDGLLLQLLAGRKNVDGRGVELSQRGVNDCVAKGLSVIQGDADTDLADYPEDSFDYVILSQTLQATQRPRVVLDHMLRIGRSAIVSFPNFGHWRVRTELLLTGRMPRAIPVRLSLVRHAEHSSLHDQGFRRARGGDRGAYRARHRARSRRRAVQVQGALARDESLRRAGDLPARTRRESASRSDGVFGAAKNLTGFCSKRRRIGRFGEPRRPRSHSGRKS